MKIFILIFMLLPLFNAECHAEDIYNTAADLSGAYAVESALPDEEREISGKFKTDGSYDVSAALGRIINKMLQSVRAELKDNFRYAAKLVVVVVFCSLASAVSLGGKMPEYINIVGCCTVAMMIAGSMDSVISDSAGAITQMSDYSKAAIPAVFSAAAACGAVVSASASYAAVCLAMDIMMSAAQNVIIPFIYAFTAISVSSSIFDNAMLKAAARFTKWCATTLMTATTLVFSGYITISGIIAGSSDVVAVKTARTIISTVLPVVGGMISDSASVVLSAANIIKNSAGVFSLVGVCSLCIGPFAMLSVKMLLFKAAAAAADMLPCGKLSTLINDVGTAFGMLLGLVGTCGIMLFISLMAGIKVVTI